MYRAPMPTPQRRGTKIGHRSTLGQRLLSHTAGLLVMYTYALVILVNGGWKLGLSREERERRRKLAASKYASVFRRSMHTMASGVRSNGPRVNII